MKNISLALLLVLATVGTAYSTVRAACCTNHLHVGDPAPDFSLKDEDGIIYTLSKLRGKKVALYFYPMDNTPGCTKQACGIRDNYDLLKKDDILIFGLSTGSQKSHASFKKKYNLPFPLLSADKATIKAYGV